MLHAGAGGSVDKKTTEQARKKNRFLEMVKIEAVGVGGNANGVMSSEAAGVYESIIGDAVRNTVDDVVDRHVRVVGRYMVNKGQSGIMEEVGQFSKEVGHCAEGFRKREEEVRKREEEVRKREEEVRRREEEVRKREEEVRKREEEVRKREEEVRKREEEVRRREEEVRKREEEVRRREEEVGAPKEGGGLPMDAMDIKMQAIDFSNFEGHRKEKEILLMRQVSERDAELARIEYLCSQHTPGISSKQLSEVSGVIENKNNALSRSIEIGEGGEIEEFFNGLRKNLVLGNALKEINDIVNRHNNNHIAVNLCCKSDVNLDCNESVMCLLTLCTDLHSVEVSQVMPNTTHERNV